MKTKTYDPHQRINDVYALANLTIEAEQLLIAACIISGRVAEQAQGLVKKEFFGFSFHSELWDRISAYAESGKPASLLALKGWLESQGQMSYVQDIVASVVSVSDWREYADIVRRGHMRRNVYTLADNLRFQAFSVAEDLSSEELAERVQQMALSITASEHIQTGGNLEHITDSAQTYLESLTASAQKPGIMTGVVALDEMIGGLRGGHLCCIGARPGMGKSAMLLTILRRNPEAVAAVYSLEMSGPQILQRWVAADLDIAVSRQQAGQLTAQDHDRIRELIESLRDRHTFVSASSRLTVERLRAQVERLHTRKPLSVVMIDYLGLLQESKGDNRNLAVAHISRELKLMAVELDIPVIALHQLNRGSEQRENKRPLLSDLRDSGAIEQDCDQVVFIHRPGMTEFKEPPKSKDYVTREGYVSALAIWHDSIQKSELIVAKNRHGSVGVSSSRFIPAKFQFQNWE